ncbi:MAG: Wadjet anti-phage system protein JetD domain-containing protein [Candidatus Sericytochromatia bacterium]
MAAWVHSMVIFGLGYGVKALEEVDWLKGKAITYWGDIDSHGFAILAQLRSVLPQTQSMLMDRETLLRHRTLWGQEPGDRRATTVPGGLTPPESALMRDLLANALGERVRLEQERVPFGALLEALAGLP